MSTRRTIGTRRKGEFVKWCLNVPQALMDRVDFFYAHPGAAHKRIYGYRSQLITQLLTEWLNTSSEAFWGQGTRRVNSPQSTKIFLSLPVQLADQVALRAPSTDGPIYGFRSTLVTRLLSEWVTKQELALIRQPSAEAEASAGPLLT